MSSGVKLVGGVNGQQAPLGSKKEEMEETETVLFLERRAIPNQGIGHGRK